MVDLNRKKKRGIVIGTVLIVICTAGILVKKNFEQREQERIRNEKYQQAMMLFEDRDYKEALKILSELDDTQESVTLIEQIEIQREEEYQSAINAIEMADYDRAMSVLKSLLDYEDSEALLAYATVCTSTSRLNNYNQYLKHIPKNYRGVFAEEIQEKRIEVDEAYEVYQKEQSAIAAQRAAEEEKAFLKSLKEELPYVGMEEKYLSSTAMGTAYYYGANTVRFGNGKSKTADIYYFYSGSSIVFTARIVDGKVYDVSDFRDDPWKRPKVFKSHPYVNNSVKGGKITEDIPGEYSSDCYDIEWYDDADDFASDWANDFDDYDDAYMYWEDHH